MRTIHPVVFVASVLAAASAAQASICTITAAQVRVASQGLSGVAGDLVDETLPIAIDEAAGTFVIDFGGLAPADVSLQGVASNITLGTAGIVSGTIDGGGNVVLPNTVVALTTQLPGAEDVSAPATMSSGLQAVNLAGVNYPTEGKPLDFVTGTLKIAGQAMTTGFELACTLAPVPSREALPKATTLVAHGSVKRGGSRGGSDDGSVVGDTLTLKATAKRGATPLDPAQDVLVRLAVAGESALLLRVPAGTLAGGRKRVASDDDGSVIRVVTGRKAVRDRSAPVSGTLTVTVSKKKLAVKLVHTGGDLSAVTDATSETTATVSIAMGPLTVSDEMTIEPGKKKTVLK